MLLQLYAKTANAGLQAMQLERGHANATMCPVCTCLQEEMLLRLQLKMHKMESEALAKPGPGHGLSIKPCCTAKQP